eukprot:SAG25_NODE_337_length_9543_cov_4.171961_19_plen_170_part_00
MEANQGNAAAAATTSREDRRAALMAPEPEVEAVTSAPARIQQTETTQPPRIEEGEKVIIKFQKGGHAVNMGRVIRVSSIINDKNDMPDRAKYKWGTDDLTVKLGRVARLPDQPAHENFDNAEAFAAAEQTYRQPVRKHTESEMNKKNIELFYWRGVCAPEPPFHILLAV